jgi:hypothetical protein
MTINLELMVRTSITTSFKISMAAFQAAIPKFDYQFASNRFQAHLRLITSIHDNENQRVETKYLSMSDHEKTLSLNNSGLAFGELLGISANDPCAKQ